MNDTHDNIDAILAWYANGSLDETETAKVDAHLETCAECRGNLAFLQQLESDLHAGNAIDERSTRPLPEDVRNQLHRGPIAGRHSLFAVAASIVLGLAIAFALGVATAPHVGKQALYRTTTSPVTHDGPRALLQVRLSADASAMQLGRFISKYDAVIHSGPDEQGWYRMEISLPADVSPAGLPDYLQAEPDTGMLDIRFVSEAMDN